MASWPGRLTEWAAAVPYMFRHLWLGYGYQGFSILLPVHTPRPEPNQSA
jgi:O-antigen ligase